MLNKKTWSTGQIFHRPAVGGATRVTRYEWGGLAHASGGQGHALFCVRAGHWAGSGGDQETFGVVLASAAAKLAPAGVAETPPLQTAHQTLRDHLVETLPVLFGNEDPEETKISLTKPKKTKAIKAKGFMFWSGRVLDPPNGFKPSKVPSELMIEAGGPTLSVRMTDKRWALLCDPVSSWREDCSTQSVEYLLALCTFPYKISLNVLFLLKEVLLSDVLKLHYSLLYLTGCTQADEKKVFVSTHSSNTASNPSRLF